MLVCAGLGLAGFVALRQGLFSAQGLTVHFVPATSSETAIAQQVQGTYDITGGNYVSYIQAQQAGKAKLGYLRRGLSDGLGRADPVHDAGRPDQASRAAEGPDRRHQRAGQHLNQAATTSFPVEGYVATKQWAKRYPHTLAAFYKALEEGQQIALGEGQRGEPGRQGRSA